jgi:hypothetical protein
MVERSVVVGLVAFLLGCGGTTSTDAPPSSGGGGIDGSDAHISPPSDDGAGGRAAGDAEGTEGNAASDATADLTTERSQLDSQRSDVVDAYADAGRMFDGASAEADSSGRCGIRASRCGFPVPPTNSTISDFNDLSVDMGLGVTTVSPGGRWNIDWTHMEFPEPMLTADDTGAPSMKTAAHFRGKLMRYGDMGAYFSGTSLTIDASAYSGVSFKVKAGAGNAQDAINFRLLGVDAAPGCGLCDAYDTGGCACYGGHYVKVPLPSDGQWHTYMFPFTRFVPTPSGFHASDMVLPGALMILAFDVVAGPAFDFWVDDVAFY